MLQFSRGQMYSQMMSGGLDSRLYQGHHEPDDMTRGLDTRLYPGTESAQYSELDNSGRYRSYKDSSGDQGKD